MSWRNKRTGDTRDASTVLFFISKAACDKGIILSSEIKVLPERDEFEGQVLGRLQIEVKMQIKVRFSA